MSMKIIIGGMISIPPFAPGIAWDWMQIAVGLRRLGHDIYYVEQVHPKWCSNAQGNPCDYADSLNRELFRSIMNRFELGASACQIYDDGEATMGLSLQALESIAKEADLLINQSGHVTHQAVLGNVRRRAYIDQDPVFTQLWRSEYQKDLNLGAHDVFFTVGLNIGTSHTPIPDCGIPWHHTLPLIVPEYWPFEIDPTCEQFTTVATWYDNYSELVYQGESYGSKSEELLRFANLPGVAKQKCEVSLKDTICPRDEAQLAEMRRGGWTVSSAARLADLGAYQQYIRNSRAEIGIAKNAYVKSRCGWFSDRAGHYLASGKPVLAQSTGFERTLPTGRGLLSFSTMEEAIDGIERINRDYATHCRAARAFAIEHLHYSNVLARFLEDCGL